MKTTGKLKEINSAQAWLLLANGTRFSFGKGLSVAGYKPGDEVSVEYEMKGDKKIATRVNRGSKAA